MELPGKVKEAVIVNHVTENLLQPNKLIKMRLIGLTASLPGRLCHQSGAFYLRWL
jgi:hypothetical protein